jgi:hypothetical protein
VVVDEQGKPIPGVSIRAIAYSPRSSANVENTESRSDGSFELFNYPEAPTFLRGAASKGVVKFFHPDYIDRDIDDLYAFEPKQRDTLRVVLAAGYKVTGTVFDVAGKPVPNAMIRAIRKDGSHRKGTMTDANGKFALRGLSKGLTSLSARAPDMKQKTLVPMALNSDKNDLEVRLRTVPFPPDLKTYAVLGMQLADVTPELQSAYDLYYEHGALILDPGKNSDRLKNRRLAEGYSFFMVGKQRIGSVREFVSQILTETDGQNADEYSVRVVYNHSTVDADLNSTGYLKLTKDDLKQLQIVSEQLAPEEP